MIHNKIRYFRKKYKITQFDLAQELGTTKQYISKLEKEGGSLGLDSCFKLLKAFISITEKKSNGMQIANITLDDLFYSDDL